MNYDHPPIRDVVAIGTDPNDPTIIRFEANNPGTFPVFPSLKPAADTLG